jgi:hypothetical protein
MTKNQALRLALEYVELVPDDRYNADHIDRDALITTIKTTLEAKYEPVVNTDHVICPNCVHQFRAIPQNVQKLMLASGFEPPFTTPPSQRKPLTDEEIHQIFIANSVAVDNGNAYMVAGLRTVNITRAIEAKLKEKNS